MATKYLSDDEVFGTSTTYLSEDEVFGRAPAPAPKPPQSSGFFSGLGSAVTEGAEKTYRSARAALSTYLGLGDDVVTQAGETARIEQDSRASDLKALKQDIQQRKAFDDDSIWSGIKNVAGAVVDNPRGAAQLVAEQAPNSAVSLGSGLAGAKAGALVGSAILPGAGTAVGGTIGFLAGLFGANALLETGGKAIEASQDKQFTPEERSQAIREGTTKGAVITAVDAATLGASKFVLGAANRAVEQATVRTLSDAGVDAAKAAASIRQAQREALEASRGAGRQATQEAVEKATVDAMGKAGLLKPDLVSAVQAAQKSAFDTTTTLGKRAGRGGAALGLQSFGEGFGEGLGEFAATGEFSPTEAVLESVAGLSMSLPELYVAKRLDAPGELTSAYSARRPDAPPAPPPAPGALEQLGTATQELEQAVTSYLTPQDVVQSTSVDEAIAKATELAAAPLPPLPPLPSPTLDERILAAEAPGLVARQLEIQRQLDEQAGLDLPSSPVRGAAPAQPELPPLQPGQTRKLSESPTFDQLAGRPGLQPGETRVLTQPSVFDAPPAGTPGLQPGETRVLSQPSVFDQPAGTPELQPGRAQIVPPPPAAAPLPAQRAIDRETQLLEQREGTPANPIPERLRLDAQRRDEAAGLIESNPQATPEILARATALRVEAQSLRTRADEIAATSAAAAQPAAGTQFERQQIDAQAAVNREMRLPEREAPASKYADLTPMTPLQARQRLVVLQDQSAQPLSLEILPHPTQKGSFAIAQRELPAASDLDIAAPAPAPVSAAEAQNRIESAELGGREQRRKRLDEARQIVVTRALKNVEERGGVASPQEAQIFQEANLGRPYDRIDESLAPKPTLALPQMEERGPATTGGGIITDSGVSVGRADRQPRGFGVNAALDFAPTGLQATTSLGAAPDTRVEGIEPTGLARAFDEQAPTGGRSATKQSEIPAAPGIPGVADTLNVNAAGQVGATDAQNQTLLGEPQDTGTELARQRIAAGYQAAVPAPAAPRPSKVNGTPTADLTSAQLTQIAGDAKLPAITRRGASIELGYRASEVSATTSAATAAPATATAPVVPATVTAPETAALPQTATPAVPKLDQPRPGVILTSSAKLSSARPAAPGATGTLDDNGVQHTYTVVDPGKLGAPGKMISQVARIFGKKLVVFESDSLQSDGFVLDDDSSSVYLNAKSSVSHLAVFGHEMVHLLKRDNAPAYAALEAVVQRNVDAKGMERFQADYGKGANLEELASDLTGNRFQEPEFWNDVFGEIAAQNPTGAKAVILKLAAALNKAVNAFKSAVSGQGFNADSYVKDLDAVKAAVKTAVVQYAQQQREPAMRMEAELMRAESQVNLTAGSSSPASVSQAAPATAGATAAPTPAAPTRTTAAAASVDDELAEVEAQSARFSRPRQELPEAPNSWKATPAEKRQAKSYAEDNGIDPYVSAGQLQPEVASAKFSVKRAYTEKDLAKGKTNHPVLGVPLNANGTVTLYFPATNEAARLVAKDKRLRGATPESNRIYLTNESSGPKVADNPGNIEQPMDGANVLVQVDPELLHLDMEHADGRKDFFIQLAEGESFARKMAQTKLFTLDAPRQKPLSKNTSINDIAEGITRGVTGYKNLALKERRAALKRAREVLKAEHNVGTLLGENGKLEKTRIGDYGLDYDGKSVVSLGLGLASAQKINEKLSTCPQAARCEGLCLGETSGQNLLYGGDGQFRSGPRLSQYLKTEALVQHPEEFAIVLYSEIERFSRNSAKEDFQPAIRLNVTSDFPPKVFQQIIESFPGTMFYDYTKLDSKTIAPNHHLTYSSTGVAQEVNGQIIGVADRDKGNPGANWAQMMKKLDQGFNVAMAFTSRTSMPEFLKDEVTGKQYRVWNGDNYDARFLDPKQPDGVGMIVGLTNKDRTGKPEDAALKYDGFFVDYDPERDGAVLTVKDQKALADKARGPERKTIPLVQASRKRSAADISIAELQGRQVSMPVRVEETGETGTLTMDAGDSLADINEREAAMQRLLECVRK